MDVIGNRGSFVTSLVIGLSLPTANASGYTKRIAFTGFIFLGYWYVSYNLSPLNQYHRSKEREKISDHLDGRLVLLFLLLLLFLSSLFPASEIHWGPKRSRRARRLLTSLGSSVSYHSTHSIPLFPLIIGVMLFLPFRSCFFLSKNPLDPL